MTQKLEGEHIYMDAIVTAPTNGGYAIYNQKFNDTILKKPCEYALAIDRFRIPMSSIPVFFFDKTPNAYTLQFGYKGVYGTRTALQYITTSPNLTIDDPYYWAIYTFDLFIKMVNDAIITAFNADKTSLGFPANSKPPFFALDYDRGTLILYAQTSFYDYTMTDPIQLYFNQNLWHFFDGIPIIEPIGGSVIGTPSATGRDALWIPFNMYTNISIIGDAPENTYYRMKSDNGFEAPANWNVAKGFYFRSNNIPVRNEILPSSASDVVNNYVNGQPVICNFDFTYNSQSLKPCVAQYVLNTPYKIIDMLGVNGLRDIDIQVFWYDKYNNSYPLELYPKDSMSIRFVFMKK
jgi:hypothetical protein